MHKYKNKCHLRNNLDRRFNSLICMMFLCHSCMLVVFILLLQLIGQKMHKSRNLCYEQYEFNTFDSNYNDKLNLHDLHSLVQMIRSRRVFKEFFFSTDTINVSISRATFPYVWLHTVSVWVFHNFSPTCFCLYNNMHELANAIHTVYT